MTGIKIKTHIAFPIQVNEINLQPISQSVAWIGKHAGAVWNRPVAVRVADGMQTYELPIRDRTRLYLILIWGVTALFTMSLLSSKPKKEQNHE